MKKKTIIIIVAIVAIAAAVCFLIFRKREYETVIENQNLTDVEKERLKEAVRQMIKDPAFNKSYEKQKAAEYGVPYAHWLVIKAADPSEFVVGITGGKADVRSI